ncbi:Retrovirus-related Pol polyprotein from transposon TNT 1-94 [Senna tora]|uniref:Retrovirus-related Pol polyprotein from transposon TNT 1-94 n=1 Tax=Senna tora TaxID=362788 RepID=A0A834T2U1_9FABA|nr:Retrovirus-related Pol polyprotein from transposon TNT 1-94 [Senna tora]
MVETNGMKRNVGVQTEEDVNVILGDIRGAELAGKGEKGPKKGESVYRDVSCKGKATMEVQEITNVTLRDPSNSGVIKCLEPETDSSSSEAEEGEFLDEASIISFFDNEEGLLIEQLKKEYEEQERDQKRRLDDGLEGVASLLEMGGSEGDMIAPSFRMASNDGEVAFCKNKGSEHFSVNLLSNEVQTNPLIDIPQKQISTSDLAYTKTNDMNTKGYSPVPPPVFNGENYQMWAVKMTAYLQAMDLWKMVAENVVIEPLPENPTMQQLKIHKKKTYSMHYIRSRGSEVWQYLKSEFQGNTRTKSIRVLNLRREFELQKMKDSENVKEYVDRLLEIVNKLKLLGEEMPDSRVVEKILVTLPERFEAKISALEEIRDLTEITLAELLNALHAQEQRRQIREDGSVEGAMKAKLQLQDSKKNKKKKWKKNKSVLGVGTENYSPTSKSGAVGNKKTNYPPCQHCGRTNHPHFRCWSRPDVKCNKCNQMGHIEKICKNKNSQQVNEAKVSFENKSCVIKDAKGQELFKIKMRGKSFALDLMEEEHSAHPVSSNTINLWHKRLGHFNQSSLLFMQKHGLVHGLTSLEKEVSGYSIHSKAYRIYKPQTKKIVISRDVVFMEEDHWDWNADESGQISHMQPSEDDVDDLPPRVKFCENDGAVKVEEKYYRSLLGCLMYLTASRPDIMHVVSLLSRFMHCASEEYLQAAKRVVRYVKGAVDFGIKYGYCEDLKKKEKWL